MLKKTHNQHQQESDSLILYKQAKIFESISKNEKKTENLRQILLEDKKFDACKLFWAIDKSSNNEITFKDLKNFIKSYKEEIPDQELKTLYSHLDKDSDGIIDWSEYLRAVLSKECSFYDYSSSSMTEITDSIALNFIELLKQEIENLKIFQKLKYRLTNLPGYNLEKIFKNIDNDDKGFFDIRDIYNFMGDFLGLGSYLRAERVLRSLDRNADGKIDFIEFEIAMNSVESEIFNEEFETEYKDFLEEKRRFLEDGSLNTESKEIEESSIEGDFLSKMSHVKESKVDYDYTPFTPNEFLKSAGVEDMPEVFRFGSDFMKSDKKDEGFDSTEYKIEKIDNFESFNKGIHQKKINFSGMKDVNWDDDAKNGEEEEEKEHDKTLLIENEPLDLEFRKISSQEDRNPTPSRRNTNLFSSSKKNKKTKKKILIQQKSKKNKKGKNMKPEPPRNSRRHLLRLGPRNLGFPQEIQPPIFSTPLGCQIWDSPPQFITPIPPHPLSRRERNRRFTSVTTTSFSPYKEVTETVFYPSGNRITTTVEKNNKKNKKSTLLTKKGFYTPNRDFFKNIDVYHGSTAEKSDFVGDLNDNFLEKSKGFNWEFIDSNKKKEIKKKRVPSTEPLKTTQRCRSNPFYSEVKNMKKNKKSEKKGKSEIFEKNEISENFGDDENFEEFLNFDNLNYEKKIFDVSLKIQEEESGSLLLPSIPLPASRKKLFLEYLKTSLKLFRELEKKIINLSLRSDFSIFDFQKIFSKSKPKTDFSDFKKNLNIICPDYNEEGKCFELFNFLDKKKRNGFLSKIDFIDTFSPFSQEFRKNFFKKNSCGIKKLEEYDNITKKSISEVFKIFEKILKFEKNSKRELYGYTRDFFEFLDQTGHGYIYMHNFGDLLNDAGIKASYREICRLIAKWDRNRDARIGFNEFIVGMNDLSL